MLYSPAVWEFKPPRVNLTNDKESFAEYCNNDQE
jgi:hypothetical protein